MNWSQRSRVLARYIKFKGAVWTLMGLGVYAAAVRKPDLVDGSSLRLLQRIRDEAHRFAIGYHRKLRGKALITSRLDQIIGIGEIKRTKLLKRFGSVEGLMGASDTALAERFLR